MPAHELLWAPSGCQKVDFIVAHRHLMFPSSVLTPNFEKSLEPIYLYLFKQEIVIISFVSILMLILQLLHQQL
jgi:hypothetical protein